MALLFQETEEYQLSAGTSLDTKAYKWTLGIFAEITCQASISYIVYNYWLTVWCYMFVMLFNSYHFSC